MSKPICYTKDQKIFCVSAEVDVVYAKIKPVASSSDGDENVLQKIADKIEEKFPQYKEFWEPLKMWVQKKLYLYLEGYP